MAKNKGGKKNVKPDKAFIVKSMKKTKTKPVTTNLKKMNMLAKANNAKLLDKTEQIDERFAALQDSVKQIQPKDMMKQAKTPQKKSKENPSTSVDMDQAAADFAKL